MTNDLFWCGIALKMDIDCRLKTHQVKCGGSVCYNRRCIDIKVYNDNKICISYINSEHRELYSNMGMRIEYTIFLMMRLKSFRPEIDKKLAAPERMPKIK